MVKNKALLFSVILGVILLSFIQVTDAQPIGITTSPLENFNIDYTNGAVHYNPFNTTWLSYSGPSQSKVTFTYGATSIKTAFTSKNLTISLWSSFNAVPTQSATKFGPVIDMTLGTPTVPRNGLYAGNGTAGAEGYVCFYLTLGLSTSSPAKVCSTSTINATGWKYITGTYDGVTMSLYINGVLNNTLANNSLINISTSYNIFMGAVDGGNMAFSGLIDEVRIYNRSLSDTEVLGVYNSGRIPNSSLSNDSLFLWAPFNENLFTTAYDLSNNRINGSINSAGTWQNDGVNLTTRGYPVSVTVGGYTNVSTLSFWNNGTIFSPTLSATNSSFYSASKTVTGISLSSSRGIWSNGTDFWIVDITAKKLVHTNSNFAKLDTFTLIGTGGISVWSNGTAFFIPDSTDNKVYVYNYSGANITNYTFTSPRGICGNGTDFWMGNTTNAVYHLNSTFGVIDSFATTYNAYGLSCNGGNQFYVHDQAGKRVYVLNSTGGQIYNFTSNLFTTDPRGFFYYDGTYYATDGTDFKVYILGYGLSFTTSFLNNDTLYILNNFSLNEIKPTTYSPLNFTFSNFTVKNISSSLLSNLTYNITTTLNVSHCNINSINYTSASGTYTQSFNSSQYTCVNKLATINLPNIEASVSGGNQLLLDYGSSDLNPPNVTINSPLNQSYNTNSIVFNVTAVDDTAVSSCWYSINGVNITMSNSTATIWNATNSSMGQGSFTARFGCNDTLGNLNATSQVTFFIDSINPSINITYPLNTTYSVKPTALNYTASDTNLQSCWYSLDSGATNTSVACGTNVTGLSAIEGSNTWQIWANDTLNNANSSSVTFYVDSVPPAINFTNPSETSGSFVNRNFIKINVTASDSGSGLKNITIRLYNSSRSLINSTNQTSSPLFSNFTGLSDGRYFFNSTAYDNFGNANSTETRNVTIDTIYPVVSIVLPTNNADFPNFISSVTIDANFSVSDTNLQSCKYDITGPQNITNLTTACSNGYNAFSYTIISPGSFTLRVYSNDSAGNENMSSINFTVTRYAGQQQGGGGSNTHVQQSATYDRAIICPSALTFISDHTKNGTLNYTAQEFTILVNQISASLKFEAQESVIKPFVNNFASYCSEYLVNPPENTTTPTPPVQPPKEEGFNYIPLLIFVVVIIVIIIIVIILSSTNNIIEVKHEKRIEGGYKYGK